MATMMFDRSSRRVNMRVLVEGQEQESNLKARIAPIVTGWMLAFPAPLA